MKAWAIGYILLYLKTKHDTVPEFFAHFRKKLFEKQVSFAEYKEIVTPA